MAPPFQNSLLSQKSDKREREEGKGILMVSGTFSKLITGSLPYYQLLCVKPEQARSLQRWLAAPVAARIGQTRLTGDFRLLMNLARSKEGSTLLPSVTPTCGKSVCLHLPEEVG